MHDEGFVLSTRPLGEADLLVTLLTSGEGKLRAVARSAKRSRRRFGAALEPLTKVRAAWSETEGRELARLESCDILKSYVQAQKDLGRFYLFAYVAEVADVFSREREPDQRFFRLVGALLDASAGGAIPPRAARRYFDLWTLRLQGLLPELTSCSRCGADPSGRRDPGPVVDLSEGVLLCGGCSEGARNEWVRLSVSSLVAVRLAMRRPPAECSHLEGARESQDGRRPAGLTSIDELARRALMRFTERPFRTLQYVTEYSG
jgi:DNA repair protein RecO (recombination protein O)